ncbi:HMG (high mobility group) box domain-containing protein [Ditylenchus destructor]|uniref:HMG (High mobility group) box domain-containing protein n=1 Tax=Ditylenchus destructor TaxID=166010 RepID=A0AAD4NL18_9BILA|nr:HMG (high mobility group) box domain-containing protein [Ditylenchus destructor]
MMNSDTSLTVDHHDLEHEAQQLTDHIEASGSKGASWLATQPKLNAKSKSGYILFSAEIRKRIMSENPEAGFGEVSKIVGVEWKKLPEENKRQYEVRAQYIAEERAKADLLTPTSKILQPGQIRVYSCRWQLCDFQFDSQDGLYEHVKSSHTSQIVDGDNQYVCLWTSCLKYRKEGKPFPSLPRLHRHIKEKHLPSSSKPIFPNQKSKHFFVYLPPQPGQSNGKEQSGHFVHQPYGVPSTNAMGCTVATPLPTTSSPPPTTPSSSSNTASSSHSHILPAGQAHHHPPASTMANGYPSSSTHYVLQQASGTGPTQQHPQYHYVSAASGQHPHGTTTVMVPVSSMGQMQGGSIMNSNGSGIQQLVQANINGATVYVPAGSHYQTIVVNHPGAAASGATHTLQPNGPTTLTTQGGHQIVVHQAPPPGHHVLQQHHAQPGQQHAVYVQQAPMHHGQASSSAGGMMNGGTVNGIAPGSSYVTAQPGSTIHVAGQQVNQAPQAHHMQAPPHSAVYTTHPQSIQHPMAHQAAPSTQGPSTSGPMHAQSGQPLANGNVAAPTMQPMIDAGRTVVQAPARPAEPVFIPPPNSIQVKRVMHSEAYVKYIESLYNSKQKTVSKWDKSLLASHRNTATNHKKLPYDWIKRVTNGHGKPKDDETVKALWKLRQQLLEETTGIASKNPDNGQ